MFWGLSSNGIFADRKHSPFKASLNLKPRGQRHKSPREQKEEADIKHE
jgi:hypothetical protein